MKDFRFSCPIDVRFRDLDPLGHVNNTVVFSYFEIARVNYVIEVGLVSPGADVRDISFILAHTACDFRQPIFYGQHVEVGARVTEIKRSSIRLLHQVEADGEIAAEGPAVLVYYDYAAQQSTPIPTAMRAKIAAFEDLGF